MKVNLWRRSLVLLALIVTSWALPATAQNTSGIVTGTVKDPQGGIIPGATVTLVSETRGTSQDTQTTGTGDFVFPNVRATRTPSR